MIYQAKYIKRLLRLAQHYASGQLHACYISMDVPKGRSESEPPFYQTEQGVIFAFFTYVDEIAYLFNEDWFFDELELPFLIEHPNLSIEDSVVEFFGITKREFIHCFVPHGQLTEIFGGKELEYHSTPQDIAHNLFALAEIHTKMN